MAGKNDVTATMGLDANEIRAELAKIVAEFKRTGDAAQSVDAAVNKMQTSTQKAAESTNFLSKGLKAIGGLFVARKAVQFGADIANTGIELHDAGIRAGITAEEIAKLGHAFELSLSKEQTAGAVSSLVSAMDAAKTGSAAAAESLGELGVKAKTIESGNAKDALFEIAEKAKSAEISVASLNKVFGDNARAVKDATKNADELKRRYSEGAGISPEAAAGAKAASRTLGGWWQSFKTKAASAYGEMAGMAFDKDYDANYQKRKAEEKAKIEAEAQEKANAEMAARWGKSPKKQRDEAMDVAIAQKELLKAEAQSNISLESKREILGRETTELEIQAQMAEKQYGIESLIALQLRAQVHEKHLAIEAADYELHVTKLRAENATKLKDAEMQGNQKLNLLLASRLNFEMQIADAMRNRRFDVAEQLRQQQRLNELDIKAKDFRKTPQERAAEDKERRANEAAQRTVMSREASRKQSADAARARLPMNDPRRNWSDDRLMGRVDATERFSKITAQRRADFAANLPPKDGANPFNDVKNMKVASLQIKEMKNAP